MKCNQISSISFKKKLMANAAILSKNMPEKVSIYELDNREEKDKMYFEKLAESTVKVLTQAIEKHSPVKNIRVPYILVERESVKKLI